MEPETPISEIEDIQLSTKSHHALPHANQSEPVAFRGHATVSCSATIVLDRQRQPTPLRCDRIPSLRAETQIDASVGSMRMFVIARALAGLSGLGKLRCS